MKVAPGPPSYQYSGRFIRARSYLIIEVEMVLGYIGHLQGDQDYGLGVVRDDGWLKMTAEVMLEGVRFAPADRHHHLYMEIHRRLATPGIIVQIPQHETAGNLMKVDGRYLAHVWPFGETLPLNTHLNNLIDGWAA